MATADKDAHQAPSPVLELKRQSEIIETTHNRIHEASERYGALIPLIPISFNLSGLCAGMFRIQGRSRQIRYNPWIFSRSFEENLLNTVAHEVAHYVVFSLYGRSGIKPHGREWRRVMSDFGVEAQVRFKSDLMGLPVRRQRRFVYVCGCTTHSVSAVRHNRMVKQKAFYFCRKCGQALEPGNRS